MGKSISTFRFKGATNKDELKELIVHYVGVDEDNITSEEQSLVAEALWRQSKFDWLTTEDRIELSDLFIETYFARFNEKPPAQALHFLSSFLMYFDLEGNRNVHKVAHEEYPILTSNQLARRRGTKGVQRDRLGNFRMEVGLGAAYAIGSDGESYTDASQERQRKREHDYVRNDKYSEDNAVRVYKVDDM